MADQIQLELLKRGASEWNAWRNANPSIEINLSGADLSGIDLTGADLTGANLIRADLSGVVLGRAMLNGADFYRANLSNADLRQVDFSAGPKGLRKTTFIEANLQGANLQGVDFTRPQMFIIFRHTHIFRGSLPEIGGVDFSRADLRGANLSTTDLRMSVLHLADLTRANLSDAVLDYADLSSTLFSLANLSDAQLEYANLSYADLSGANLSDAMLSMSNLCNTYFIGAKLNGAQLQRVNLSYADLSGANLSDADLRRANLSYATLKEANLSGANLHQANLSGASIARANNLNQADLADAIMAVPIGTLPKSMVSKTLGIMTNNSNHQTTRNTTAFHLRIDESPLYLNHVAHVLSALTHLGVVCWLTAQGQYRDVVTYTQTRDLRITEEAPFVITDVSYGSFDATINFPNLDPKNIAEALHTGLDTFLLAGQRLKQARLDTEEKAARLQQVQKQVELEYQAKQQELTIAAQKATQDEQLAQLERDRQKFELERQYLLLQIELDRQKLELERQHIALQRELAELENMRMTNAIEAANKMISMLAPDTDQAARAMLVQSYLPSILQFHAVPNLPLQFSVEKSDSDTNVDEQVGPAPSGAESDL